jgi:hypothetical protein
MQGVGQRLQTANPRRPKAKNSAANAGAKVRKRVLRWFTLEPEETPAQIAERLDREAIEDREDFLIEFWNGLPASERIRLCTRGGAIHNEIHRYNFQALPTEVIAKRKSTLGI